MSRASVLSPQEENALRQQLGDAYWPPIAQTDTKLFFSKLRNGEPGEWIYSEACGAVFLVEHRMTRVKKVQLWDLSTLKLLLEQELSHGVNYVDQCPSFHSFEVKRGNAKAELLAGFGFYCDEDGAYFADHVLNRPVKRTPPKPLGIGRNVVPVVPSASNNTIKKKKKGFLSSIVDTFFGEKEMQISGPMNVVHMQHIGYDPEEGFDVKMPGVNSVLKSAGVDDSHLKNSMQYNSYKPSQQLSQPPAPSMFRSPTFSSQHTPSPSNSSESSTSSIRSFSNGSNDSFQGENYSLPQRQATGFVSKVSFAQSSESSLFSQSKGSLAPPPPRTTIPTSNSTLRSNIPPPSVPKLPQAVNNANFYSSPSEDQFLMKPNSKSIPPPSHFAPSFSSNYENNHQPSRESHGYDSDYNQAQRSIPPPSVDQSFRQRSMQPPPRDNFSQNSEPIQIPKIVPPPTFNPSRGPPPPVVAAGPSSFGSNNQSRGPPPPAVSSGSFGVNQSRGGPPPSVISGPPMSFGGPPVFGGPPPPVSVGPPVSMMGSQPGPPSQVTSKPTSQKPAGSFFSSMFSSFGSNETSNNSSDESGSGAPSALLSSIEGFSKKGLKKTVTNDKSSGLLAVAKGPMNASRPAMPQPMIPQVSVPQSRLNNESMRNVPPPRAESGFTSGIAPPPPKKSMASETTSYSSYATSKASIPPPSFGAQSNYYDENTNSNNRYSNDSMHEAPPTSILRKMNAPPPAQCMPPPPKRNVPPPNENYSNCNNNFSARGPSLMDSIQAGSNLRPVVASPVKREPEKKDMFDQMKEKLGLVRNAVHQDDNESDWDE